MATLSTASSFQTSYYKVANFGFTSTLITDGYPSFFYPFNPMQQAAGIFFPDFQNLVQGDFNGDGTRDIALTWSYFPHFFTRPDSILARSLIFFNDGHGNLYSDPSRFTTAASGGRTILETSSVADFNGDGIDDIVSSSGGLNNLIAGTYVGEPIPLVLSGPGGVFSDATRNIAGQEDGHSLPTGFLFAHDITVGDFDGDHDIDIFTDKLLLLNDGTGHFSNATMQLPPALRAGGYFMFSSAAGDFDKDGITDIATFGGAPNQPSTTAGGYVLLSGGKADFSQRTLVSLPVGYFGAAASTTRDSAVGDIDGDGDLDLVALTSRDSPNFLQGLALQILINDGSGHFTDGTAGRIDNAPLANLSATGQTTATTGYGGSDVYLVDWNGDGHLDLITHSGIGPTTNTRPLISIFQNDGTGHFDPVDLSFLPYVQPWQLAGYEGLQQYLSQPPRQTAPADLNGDRMIDFVSVVDTPRSTFNGPQEATAYTILSQAVYGTGPHGIDGAAVGAPGFNEAYYLHTNPSAAAAVAQGQYATGLAHYLAVGQRSGLFSFAPGTTVYGGAGADTIRLREGNEKADGGAGTDTVIFSGSRSSYTVQRNATGFTVNGREGNDSLTSIERLKFSDGATAYDLDAGAGRVAKILGAVFGKTSLTNKEYVGIGLNLLDAGTSYADLMQLAINVRLGAGASNTDVVNLLYTNVVGSAPSASELALYRGALDGGMFSRGSLGVLAADTPLNQANINLVGLAVTGIDYL